MARAGVTIWRSAYPGLCRASIRHGVGSVKHIRYLTSSTSEPPKTATSPFQPMSREFLAKVRKQRLTAFVAGTALMGAAVAGRCMRPLVCACVTAARP